MTRIGTIDFSDNIFDALKEENLVVFAGAGVSMGDPSNLPSYKKLAEGIASGSRRVLSDPKHLDRFLGELKDDGVLVYKRAVEILSPPTSKPTPLHNDLLKLFRSNELVRIITTNYDYHFETAALSLFDSLPEAFRAPALPLGRDFKGIVHVHGALRYPNEMVLTDDDFGRAYLTEGWARRFLTDVFQRYTVLFVGYSHDDVVMNYLARALPANSGTNRYILTPESDVNWDFLGINPLYYKLGVGEETHKQLNDSIHLLAERVCRGSLDWQTRLAEICGGVPPTDEETIDEVEQALRETYTTRFFVKNATNSEWLAWLNTRNHLEVFFSQKKLNERDQILASWITEKYAVNHVDAILDLIAAHNLQINPDFWWLIVRALKSISDIKLEDSVLKRWVTIMLAGMPEQVDYITLLWLAETCSKQNDVQLTLMVFLAMCKLKLKIKPGFVWNDSDNNEHGQRLEANCSMCSDIYSLQEVWINLIRPNISTVAHPLLMEMVNRFEERHRELSAWGGVNRNVDPASLCRSAIEQHQQDGEHQEDIDILIDAIRDTFEWLSKNSPLLLEAWTELLVMSDAPLLRRLAIHGNFICPNKTSDERLVWIMNRIGLFSFAERHEIYRTLERCFPDASSDVCKRIFDAICLYELPSSEDSSAEKKTARARFDILSWLIKAKPDCQLVCSALDKIKFENPGWLPSEHPDLYAWSSPVTWGCSQSPLSVEQLLDKEPREHLDYLLTYKEENFNGPDRDGLIAVVKDVCQQNIEWAFSLTESLIERKLFASDLWPAIIRGWQEGDLSVDNWKNALSKIIEAELYATHTYNVANLLVTIVSKEEKLIAFNILEQADSVALLVWSKLESGEPNEQIDDWLFSAINHAAGVIVEYWLKGISLINLNISRNNRSIPLKYQKWFEMVAQDPTSNGGYGRSLLSAQLAYLFGLDEKWTIKHIIPMFSHTDRFIFRQAWSGFLTWGKLYPELSEVLVPAFESAAKRLDTDIQSKRKQFIQAFASLAIFHVEDPLQEFIPSLINQNSLENIVEFASSIAFYLRNMQPDSKEKLWGRWLRKYWEQRLNNVPVVLSEDESVKMLDWLPSLADVYPEAVSLAVRLPGKHIEHCRLFHDLCESDVVTLYPEDTAELLIYLSSCFVGYHTEDLKKINNRLPELTPKMRYILDDVLARIGAQ